MIIFLETDWEPLFEHLHAPTGRRWSCCRRSWMCCRSNTPGNAWKTLSCTRSCRTREKPWCSAKKRTEGFKRSRWKLVFGSSAAVFAPERNSSITSPFTEADGEDAAVIAKWETTTWLLWNERLLWNGGGQSRYAPSLQWGSSHSADGETVADFHVHQPVHHPLNVTSHHAFGIDKMASQNDAGQRHLQGANQNEHIPSYEVTLEINSFLVIFWCLSCFLQQLKYNNSTTPKSTIERFDMTQFHDHSHPQSCFQDFFLFIV